ncbi:Insulysin protein [Dioscorea alata]|uniref:Insulysin protein n=1 Tax=Dioscorea alata TaxID=55571 RepID=A0ACB7UMY2_DIOAL|nr:Insulysin protein [Dioscorea alata]
MAVGSPEPVILKPRTDKREYRRIVLPNSLEALLISDPETKKAAAAMNVSVGYFSDPEGLEGLAHFLEHMLFYASEKYPVEDSYSNFITEHGGSKNANTASERTNFFFDINADYLDEALDRFGQFFISPLISPDATKREIKAVDSEYKKNLLSDIRRSFQLRKHICSKDHPYHKFSTGNWDTLEIIPKAKGLDTRLELIKFYKENYSANIMHLVVYGKESLDKLQNLVESNFKDVLNIDRAKNCFPGHPCSSEHLQILVKVVPVEGYHMLRIIWPVTPNIRHYKESPSRYLSHLIGHRGVGSLFYVLKSLEWATRLIAGEGDSSYDFAFFCVNIELTSSGNEHVEDVVGLLFKYIALLRNSGINQWIFNELVAICDVDFHYKDKIPPINYVVNIADNMQLFPPEDWLCGSSLPSRYDPSTIKGMLDMLTPNNIRIFWESQKFNGCTDSLEPWYKTSYTMERITASSIQQWIEKAPNELLHLPAPNEFIPTDLRLIQVEKKVKLPVLLRTSLFSNLWYKPDTTFFIPKGYVRIDFNCPESKSSLEAVVLTNIFTRLLADYLNEYAYSATVASLKYKIQCYEHGFQVVVSGYNHKLRHLLEVIINEIKQFEVKLDRFSVIKETMKRNLNIKFQQPYRQAVFYCALLLDEQRLPLNEQLEILHFLEADHLTKFYPCLLSRAFVECYIAGNIGSAVAESIIEHVEDVLFKSSHPTSKPLLPSQHLTNRIVKLKRGLGYYYPVEGLNPANENSALVYYIQVHQDNIKLSVKLQLFTLLAEEPAFHQLRSVEQLGYITALKPGNFSGVCGLQFLIQSTVMDPAQLDGRVEAFLKMFENKLYEMTDDQFKSMANVLIDLKLGEYNNLSEESDAYCKEIVDGTFRFDRHESKVAALRELTRQELIEFFNSYIKVGAPQRKTLSIRCYGRLHSAEFQSSIRGSSQPQNCQIKDICSFKKSRPLYGSFRGGLGQMKLEDWRGPSQASPRTRSNNDGDDELEKNQKRKRKDRDEEKSTKRREV